MAKSITVNQTKYDKENTVRYSLKLNKKTDKDIITLIEDTADKLGISKQNAIKMLIKNEV